MRIDNEQSRKIYELAKDPNNKLTNREIGEKFGIDEATVRYHVKKWEGRLHEIAKTNEKAAGAIANHAVDVHTEAKDILAAVKASIQDAKDAGVSPERLAPLYSNWIKGLETLSELLGDINRAPQVNIQVNQQFNDFMSVVLSEVNDVDRARIISKLKPAALY
jgi:DNA-binding Lrp family transcriptional regulator